MPVLDTFRLYIKTHIRDANILVPACIVSFSLVLVFPKHSRISSQTDCGICWQKERKCLTVDTTNVPLGRRLKIPWHLACA